MEKCLLKKCLVNPKMGVLGASAGRDSPSKNKLCFNPRQASTREVRLCLKAAVAKKCQHEGIWNIFCLIHWKLVTLFGFLCCFGGWPFQYHMDFRTLWGSWGFLENLWKCWKWDQASEASGECWIYWWILSISWNGSFLGLFVWLWLHPLTLNIFIPFWPRNCFPP